MRLRFALVLTSFVTLAACSGSSSSSSDNGTGGSGGTGSGGNFVSEQKLVTKWCTTSMNTMESLFGEKKGYWFFHRVTFAADGYLNWQAYSTDHGLTQKSWKKTTCRQETNGDTGVLHCDAKGVATLYYEFSQEGRVLNILVDGDNGQKKQLVEKGNLFVACSQDENDRFDNFDWN